MMKKIMNMKTLAMGLAVASLGLAACSDAFLEEKKDLDNVSSIIYDDFEGAEGRVNDCYSRSLRGGASIDVYSPQHNMRIMNFGDIDEYSQSTEEYSGLSVWVDPEYNLNNVNYVGQKLHADMWQGKKLSVAQSAYGRIRNFNDIIRGISNGSLPQEEKDMLLGQVHFWRAWAYYQLVKWYGGVPIVTEVLDPVEGPGSPRSSAKECFQFIFDELDLSAQLLEAATGQGGWADSSDWGRVTTATALALKGRLMNLWASPMFNRQNDPARWEAAYQFINESLPKIRACGHGLVDGSTQTAAGWANIFARTDRNPEAVLVQNFNTHDSSSDTQENVVLNNNWEDNIRPENTGGNGGLQPSQMIIDLFPMKDGKVPSAASNYTTLGVSEIEYDEACPWMNRDPRFYRTFAFPGVRWAMNGDPSQFSTNNWVGGDYECWSYVWYLKDDASKIDAFRSSSSHGPDGLNGSAKGFYVRKRTCDSDVSAANYLYQGSFSRSAAPYIEIRYTEVLLNLAEAAAGANKLDIAVDQLRQIRSRVGYTGDCGIASGMSQGQTMAAVLYERMIELAFEGKRFEDARRWMLFDGGAELPSGAPSTWNVSGWGGNTCTWLGIAPLNGKRRENYEFHVTYDAGLGAGIGEDLAKGDPLTNLADPAIVRPAAIDFRKEGEELTAQFDALKAFYGQYLACKVYSGDGYNETTGMDYVITWRPHYYFLGTRTSELMRMYEQTIGWDKTDGSWGTFDPLASNSVQ